MKILFISSWFPNKLEPTNGNFVQRHAEAVALLHDVEILHTIGDINQKEKFISDDKIINGIRTLIIYYKNSSNPVLNFLRRMKAYKLGFSKMQKPDLIHANVLHNNMLFAVYLKRKYKIPFVVTEHWTALRKVNKDITPFTDKKIAKFIGNQANMLLPVSNDLRNGLKNLGIKTPMKVIPNVVNTSLFAPGDRKNKKFTFIHISNLITRKNPGKIINTGINLLKQGYDFNLQIGGDGDCSELMSRVKDESLQNRIEVFGMQTLEQVSERMRISDCFILFSDDENQPCVIAEAFASGIKVISTDVGGVSEFFPNNFGILLKNTNEKGLMKAMINMLENHYSYNRDELAEYAKNTFSREIIADKYTQVYQDILKQDKDI